MGWGKPNVELLNKRISELEQANADLNRELMDNRSTIEGFVTVKHSYQAKLDKMESLCKELLAVQKATYESEVKQLNTKLARTEKSINRRVNQELENIGVNKFAMEDYSTTQQAPTGNKILEQWLKMPDGMDKHDFYNKNANVIDRAFKNTI